MMEVDREDIVLLLLEANQRIAGRESFRGVTRLEKLVFLLAKEKGLAAADQHFGFKAYKFGPFSKDVYEATEFLRGLGFLTVDERPFASYSTAAEELLVADETSDEEETPAAGHEKIYSLTPTGHTVAQRLREAWQKERPGDLAQIDDVVSRMGLMPLNQLIRYVYRRFPAMASESIHPEATKLP